MTVSAGDDPQRVAKQAERITLENMTRVGGGVAAALVVVLAALSLVPAGRSGTGDVLKPPVITEPFTVLPCPAKARTTVAMEGCMEKVILATDRQINTLARAIFYALAPSARKPFVESERSWLRYRHSSCLADASVYVGGSIYPIKYGYCEVARNRAHLTDLSSLRCDLYPQDAVPRSCRR